jgi:integrase
MEPTLMARKRAPQEASKRAPKGSGSLEQLPNGKWRVIVSGVDPVTGKRAKLSKTFDTQREAVAFKGEAEELLKAKLQASSAGLGKSGALTLYAYLEDWLKRKTGKVENATWTWYEKRLRLQLLPVVGVVLLRDLTSLLVERFLTEMRAEGGKLEKPVSVYGQRGALTTLRVALADAVKHKLILANVATLVKLPKEEYQEAKWWSPAEAAAFLACPRVAAHRLYALFRMGLDSGMRQGELLALRWHDVDFAGKTVHVRRNLEHVRGVKKEKAPKSKAGIRKLPVAKETMDILAEHREKMNALGWDVKEGVVFPNARGGWINDSHLRKIYCRLVAAAKVSTMRCYDLRHTAASMWLANGASIRAVADRLGHEDPAITRRYYAHCLPNEQAAIAEMSARLLAPTSSPMK